MIRVGVAARSAIVRAGLTTLLKESGFTVVGAAAPDRLEEIDRWQAEAILLELEGTDEDLSLLLPLVEPRLDQTAPQTIVLLEEGEPETVRELLRLGIRGILPQAIGSAEISAAIEAVMAGLIVLHPDFTEDLQPALTELPAALPVFPATAVSLTARETEVLHMIAEGMSNKTIALRLHLSEHTVKFHISSIFSKLQVSSRTEAVIAGTRLGLILL
ncbi:response regulator transcription factor [Leptolyngbya ohadii]|uniref:response regulator transcription factor n=1 Tax=Leptolyngbya ohadii TaxID=1962290 RepID=UPI000B59E4B5|nr:response regulator transcription factor [Leptolyngbya ohadii]